MPDDIAMQIQTARKARRLTRSGLAQEIGVELADIEAFETGKRQPDARVRTELARVLRVDLSGTPDASRSTARGEGRAATRSAGGRGSRSGSARSAASDASPASRKKERPDDAPGKLLQLPIDTGDDAPAASAPAKPRKDAPRTQDRADDERAEKIIALLERVTGGTFLYKDGQAYLIRPENGIAATTRSMGAYALLTDLLLTSGFSLDKRTTDEIRKVLRS